MYQTQGRRSSRRRGRKCRCDGLEDDENYQGELRRLEVKMDQRCEEYPFFQMDESYNLKIGNASKLESKTIWGIMRGMESFSQLLYLSNSGNQVLINATSIVDNPRFTHRGLLLDTSRHFMSLPTILTIIDGMSMNKMNVFHWHIVDDQSFPYVSEKFPDLSRKGAYSPSMVYKVDDIKEVIEYARQRGIRVVPEFDVPGHTRSWGIAYPEVLTECYNKGVVVGLGPMNPARNVTYNLIKDLFEEVQKRFPDNYFHIGGDEVELSCWSSNPELMEYVHKNNMSVRDLHSLFMRNVIPLLTKGTTPVVWQEVFDEGVPLSSETLIHVWKWNWIGDLVRALDSGHRVIFSSEWYLDHLNYEFDKLYEADPQKAIHGLLRNSTYEKNIVGGEACMWSEMVDDRNVITRVWPRASAVAERLWSAPLSDSVSEKESTMEIARHRLEEHTCRMNKRGVPAAPPSAAGFCVT